MYEANKKKKRAGGWGWEDSNEQKQGKHNNRKKIKKKLLHARWVPKALKPSSQRKGDAEREE